MHGWDKIENAGSARKASDEFGLGNLSYIRLATTADIRAYLPRSAAIPNQIPLFLGVSGAVACGRGDVETSLASGDPKRATEQ